MWRRSKCALQKLKKVNKSKLKNGKKKSVVKKEENSTYEKTEVFEIFQNHSLDQIVVYSAVSHQDKKLLSGE